MEKVWVLLRDDYSLIDVFATEEQAKIARLEAIAICKLNNNSGLNEALNYKIEKYTIRNSYYTSNIEHFLEKI